MNHSGLEIEKYQYLNDTIGELCASGDILPDPFSEHGFRIDPQIGRLFA